MNPSSLLLLAQYTDIHLHLDSLDKSSLFLSSGGVKRPGSEMLEILGALRDVVSAQRLKEDDPDSSFIVSYEGLLLRAQKMWRPGGEAVTALRVLRDQIDSLLDLGFGSYHRNLILNSDIRRRGGLVLIGGPAGGGKTTTAGSIVKSWLEADGGYCLTVEDPPELPLDGVHGDGMCEQTRLKGDPHKCLCDALRCFPAGVNSILFYGEIRDARAAAELLRLSVDGHLIIATIHAGDVQQTIQRMLSLGNFGGEPEAKELLANSLRLVIHQRKLSGQQLQATALDVDETVAATIRTGKINSLTDRIQLSERKAATLGR